MEGKANHSGQEEVKLSALILAGLLAASLDKCPCKPCPPAPPTPTPGPTPTPAPTPTPTPTPEPATGCRFPQGVPESDFTYLGVRTPTLQDAVNAALVDATGCAVGQTCVTNLGPSELFDRVNKFLRGNGLCAGRHEDIPDGGTDEIAVARKCTDAWEGYHIYNYGNSGVIWAPNSYRGDWTIKAVHCGDPEPTPDPTHCPAYLERFTVFMHPKGEYTEYYGRLDATPKADIAYCKTLVPPRNHCPVPDSCLDKVVGEPQWSVVPGEPVVICGPEGCPGSANLTNPYLKDIQGWGRIRICTSVLPQHCTVCSVHENAVDGADAQAECIPES